MELRRAKEELKKYNIELKEIKGYKGLNDLNKATFEKFLVDFLEEQLGGENIIPESIHWVEEIDYAVHDEVDGGTIVGNSVYILEDGGRRLLKEFFDDDYEGVLEAVETKEYLRFEYLKYGDGAPRHEWMHVEEQGAKWY